MSGLGLGLAVEGLVTVLLAITVGYCVMLDRRLQQFKKDEGSIRQTVIELAMATERAEHAIAGLRNTVSDADGSLTDRLRAAERFTAEFDHKLKSGDEILTRIMQIVSASRSAAMVETPVEPVAVKQAEKIEDQRANRLADTLASARAMADRIRARRLPGLADAGQEPTAA